jgi:hypothetical protein
MGFRGKKSILVIKIWTYGGNMRRIWGILESILCSFPHEPVIFKKLEKDIFDSHISP